MTSQSVRFMRILSGQIGDNSSLFIIRSNPININSWHVAVAKICIWREWWGVFDEWQTNNVLYTVSSHSHPALVFYGLLLLWPIVASSVVAD